jgi:hypothetical protein
VVTLQVRDLDFVEHFDLIVCTWLHQLSINECWLCELPSSIALLTDLMELDLSFNQFTSIDAIDFVRMSKLTSLNVSIDCFCHSRLFEFPYFVDFVALRQSTWTVIELQLERCDVADRTRYFLQ